MAQSEPTGEVACIPKVRHIARSSRHHRSGSEQPDTRHRQQQGASRTLPDCQAQWPLHLGSARFQQPDFFKQLPSGVADQFRNGGLRISQHPAEGFDACAGTLGNRNTKLSAKPPQDVGARGARAHPQRAKCGAALAWLVVQRTPRARGAGLKPWQLQAKQPHRWHRSCCAARSHGEIELMRTPKGK